MPRRMSSESDSDKTDRDLAVRFEKAVRMAAANDKTRDSIGILSEKLLHASVKNFYCDLEQYQEVRIGSHVADICRDGSIIEVQNGNFNKLREKLQDFLKEYYVTVVYPLPASKILTWVNPESGEITSSRKSPKKGNPMDAIRELYRIRSFLSDPGLSIELLFIDMEEIRFQDGWSRDGKKGSHRMERIPRSISRITELHNSADYGKFLPQGLPETFTSSDFAKAWKTSRTRAGTALLILTEQNIVGRIGKKGNAILYRSLQEKKQEKL